VARATAKCSTRHRAGLVHASEIGKAENEGATFYRKSVERSPQRRGDIAVGTLQKSADGAYCEFRFVPSDGPEGTTGEFSNRPGGWSCTASAGLATSAAASAMIERFMGCAP
jgi:hypothetical protein